MQPLNHQTELCGGVRAEVLHLTPKCGACYSIRVSNKAAQKADVLQGTLDLMVLQTLDTLGPVHGYTIAGRLEQVSSGALQLNMGTLYPALMRLEQRGLVRGAWGATETNRRARFYSLTAAGRRQLGKERESWDRMATIIHTLLRGEA
jgi:transcriptional regulator